MHKAELERILPHRPPMLLIDEAEAQGDEAQGRVTITGDEFFCQGHFPGNPVVPGVILCEMLAQTCCVLVGAGDGLAGKTPLYTGLEHVRFKHPVRPGDTLELRCTLTRRRGPFVFAHGEAYVAEELAACADMSFAIVDAQDATA